MPPIKTGFRDILPDDPTKVLLGNGEFGPPPAGGGSAIWGGIGGTLVDQADLGAALSGKAAAGHDHDADYDALGEADAERAAHESAHNHALLHSSSLDHPNANDPAAGEKAALAGTSGTPGSGNKYVTDSDPRLGGSFQFPVGWILQSYCNINPGTFLGYGTWALTATGRVFVGIDPADPDFDTPEEIRGAKTSTPDAHVGVAVAQHAAAPTGQASAGATQRGTTSSTLTLLAHTHQTPVLSHSVTQPSAHAAMSVVQPSIVCYYWKRTA